MRALISKFVENALPGAVSFVIETAPDPKFGHFATNVAMRIAALEKRPPLEVARRIAQKISAADTAGFFEKVEVAPPGFVNFWVSKRTLRKELGRAVRLKERYGAGAAGRGKKVIVEYSDPNIAKRMHFGHLRSTIIGDALANVHDFLGYRTIRWNYLGDWGTQFGKMITAYKLWGNRAEIEKDPVTALQALYVRFHEEMKEKPELERQGREEFKKLEAGDHENRALWKWFRDESLKEFNRTYKRLGISFDVTIGESFY